MNSTNTRKQLATEEACKKEMRSWGSQVNINQCHINTKKTKPQTKKTHQTRSVA